MNFDFSDEQKQLREQARRFLDERCSTRAARARVDGAGFDRGLWKAMAELGWAGTAIPEEYGGVGLGYVDLCVIAEELGRSVAPVPFSSSIYLAAESILNAGSDEQKRGWLPKIASGEAIGTFALSEGTKAATAANLTTRFDGKTVSGTKLPVLDADAADFVIVVARGNGRDVVLCRVDLHGAGVTIEAVESIDPSRGHARVTFDRAPAEALAAGEGWATVERIQDAGAILLAFEQIGGADRSLEMARDYALERLCLRAPDRLLPGDQAQAGRCLDRQRDRPLQRLLRRLGAGQRMPPSCRSPPRLRASPPARPSGRRRRRTSRRTAAWASPGNSTATSIIAAPIC